MFQVSLLFPSQPPSPVHPSSPCPSPRLSYPPPFPPNLFSVDIFVREGQFWPRYPLRRDNIKKLRRGIIFKRRKEDMAALLSQIRLLQLEAFNIFAHLFITPDISVTHFVRRFWGFISSVLTLGFNMLFFPAISTSEASLCLSLSRFGLEVFEHFPFLDVEQLL